MSKTLVIYDSVGRILRTCDGVYGDPSLLVTEGESFVLIEPPKDGMLDIAMNMVDGGEVVPLPPKPSEYHRFDYVNKTWVLDHSRQWRKVRSKRNQLLQESDWTQLPDVPIANKDAWAEYRQALRDITEQPDPFNIAWPTPPDG
jgi:uncharacterized protein YjiS (DUF1127 family)